GPVAASEIQDLEPVGDIQRGYQCLAALAHALCDAGEVALLPERLVRVCAQRRLLCVRERLTSRPQSRDVNQRAQLPTRVMRMQGVRNVCAREPERRSGGVTQ